MDKIRVENKFSEIKKKELSRDDKLLETVIQFQISIQIFK
jgi:hypothetical protein